ncbi:hypothetical protein ABT189_02525 [Streptomyces sp900105755]|uniref:hypothetical protein n=1 Tax=Streptomyces sp. 900105755 TaxID=3154389 RepID=UPI0033298671
MGDAAVRATPDNVPTVPGEVGTELDGARSPEGATDSVVPRAGSDPPPLPAAAPASPPQAETPTTAATATTT